jgi:hypothetical protein
VDVVGNGLDLDTWHILTVAPFWRHEVRTGADAFPDIWAYDRAVELTTNNVERAFLVRQRAGF